MVHYYLSYFNSKIGAREKASDYLASAKDCSLDYTFPYRSETETVLEYTKPRVGGEVVKGHDPKMKPDGQLLKEGFIALQSEGQPIDFRNIKIKNLKGCMDPKASNYRKYYIKSDEDACSY